MTQSACTQTKPKTRNDYQQELSAVLGSSKPDLESLSRYLSSGSNLPGPRANLELIEAFSRSIAALSRERTPMVWKLALELSSAEDEFVTMCGVRGLGEVGGHVSTYHEKAVGYLQGFSADPRWRVREAVAMALKPNLNGFRIHS